MASGQNVGEVDHNIRMFLAVPALIVVVESIMVFGNFAVALGAALAGAAIWTSGARRVCPLYRVLGIDTRFGQRAAVTPATRP